MSVQKTILILAANPTDTPPLRFDREVREIDHGLQRSTRRDEFTLKQKWAARPVDVRRAMLDLRPNIVHFCGHGSGEEGIAFEDDAGEARLVKGQTLAHFFKLFIDTVECVVLNDGSRLTVRFSCIADSPFRYPSIAIRSRARGRRRLPHILRSRERPLKSQAMPAKPTWLLRLPEIVGALSAMAVPVIDRATCERLFGVRRRRAVELMQRFGGYQVGHALLADRLRLIQQLQALDTDPNVLHERRRKQRLTAELDRIRHYSIAATVPIEVPKSLGPSANSALPSGVSISAGKLVIEFARVEELFSRLYGLAQVAAADYETFCRVVQA